jgi:hypothetical protein
MAYLYKNPKGQEVTRHSYSAGSDFDCPRFYQLKRIVGWREKQERAALRFGNAIETALQLFHTKDAIMANEFARIWGKLQDEKLDYGESSFEEMGEQGWQLSLLYPVIAPKLPITNPKFQLNYEKELYPGTYLSGIKFTAYVDILSEWNYTDRLIIDVKTTAGYPPSAPVRMDPQLRAYSWVSGYPNVAFLYFVRCGLEIKKGNKVTLLVNAPPFEAGDEALVFSVENPENGKTMVSLLNQETYDTYAAAASGLKGKALDVIKANYASKIITLPADAVTKQRLVFIPGAISAQEREETGEAIGKQVAEIVAAREKNVWAQRPGVRFPHDVCTNCPMLGICTENEKLRDEKLVASENLQKEALSVEEEWDKLFS